MSLDNFNIFVVDDLAVCVFFGAPGVTKLLLPDLVVVLGGFLVG